MTTTKVSSKGQVVIPKVLRDAQGWSAGTELVIEIAADGLLLRTGRRHAPTTVDEVAGMLKADYSGPARSIEEIDAAVLDEAASRARRTGKA